MDKTTATNTPEFNQKFNQNKGELRNRKPKFNQNTTKTQKREIKTKYSGLYTEV